MKLALPKLLSLMLALFIGSSLATAQWSPPPPPHIISLDVITNGAPTIVVGTLDAVPPADEWSKREITISVKQVLKGKAVATVKVPITQSDLTLNEWKKNGTLLLVAMPADPAKEPSLTNLGQKDLTVMTSDLRLLKTADEIIQEVRKVAGNAKAPGPEKSFTLAVPTQKVAGTPLVGIDPKYYANIKLEVPVDSRLQKNAYASIASDNPERRVNGVKALGNFDSPANIGFLKSLLSDNHWEENIHDEGNEILRFRYNNVRREALASLAQLKVIVKPPMVEDPPARDDRVVCISFEDGTFTDENLATILKRRNLEVLNLSNARLTSAQWSALGPLKKLKTLFLDSSNISNDDLKRLPTFPQLTYIGLGNTDITNAGLPLFAKFKRLKKVDAGVRVTQAGVNDLHKLLATVDVRLDDLAVLSPLHPQRVEQPLMASRWYYAGGGPIMDGLGFRSYILLFPEESEKKLDELLPTLLSKAGWARDNSWGSYRRPSVKLIRANYDEIIFLYRSIYGSPTLELAGVERGKRPILIVNRNRELK